MKLSHWALIASIGLAASAMPARAFTLGADLAAPTAQAVIIDVAVNCGQHAHYVRGHRDARNHYIKGRCVRDKLPPRHAPKPEPHR